MNQPAKDKKQAKKELALAKKAEKAAKKGKILPSKDTKKKGVSVLTVLILLSVLLIMIAGAEGYLLFAKGDAAYTMSVVKTGKTFKEAASADTQQQEENLKSELDAFDKKKEDMDKREQALNTLEERLNKKQQALNEQESTGTLQEATTQEETLHLISIYETMEASKAADIFGKMNDINNVVTLLSGMKQTRASKILQAMDASLAASITKSIMFKEASGISGQESGTPSPSPAPSQSTPNS